MRETHEHAEAEELHEFYVLQINTLVAEDRESLIPHLVADFDREQRGRYRHREARNGTCSRI
ncbi:MAG: hypothetical protein JWR52_1772 [Marmoricola sp.]|nr:hypothetical protein [Marmoricola sp.]